MFSCETCEIFKNIFYHRTIPVAASVISSWIKCFIVSNLEEYCGWPRVVQYRSTAWSVQIRSFSWYLDSVFGHLSHSETYLEPYQTSITKLCWNLNAVNYFRKTLHRRCLIEFYIRIAVFSVSKTKYCLTSCSFFPKKTFQSNTFVAYKPKTDNFSH